MRIVKILNNNAVLVDDGIIEQVVMGRGIAFGRKVGDRISRDVVDRAYCLSDPELTKQLIELLKFADVSLVELVQESIEEIKLEIQEDISDTLYVRLIDHFMMSIKRYKQNMSIICPLVYDVQCFYPSEYRLAKNMVTNVNKIYEIELDENEITFVTLHIVDATLHSMPNMMGEKITKFIKQIISIVRNYYGFALEEKTISYYRFISHLRFFATRLFSEGTHTVNNSSDELVQVVKVKYPDTFKCSLLIQEFIVHQYNFEIGNDELLYLTIHIQRIAEYYEEERENK